MFNKICILIPVYNEEKKIGNVVSELHKIFPNIIVVNDGSSDSTLQILKTLNVTVLNHLVNLGQGAAISTGFKYIEELKNIQTTCIGGGMICANEGCDDCRLNFPSEETVKENMFSNSLCFVPK